MSEKITRRKFLSNCFRSTAAALTLTACGRFSTLAFADGKGHGDKDGDIEVGESGLIASVSDLGKKKSIPFVFKGKRSILVDNDGEYRAFENICTHKGGPTMSRGKHLVCKWHGAKFDPLTGKALTKPAPGGSMLKAIALRIDENNIYVAKDMLGENS